jgi:hypothetical protein
MRGSLVTLCVGIAVGLLASCESTKSPKTDRPVAAPAAPAQVAAPIASSARRDPPKVAEKMPALSQVAPTAPLAMEKLAAAQGEGDDEGQESDVFAIAAAFPDRLLPAEKFSEKMAKRIRYKLRDVTKAPIALRHFIQAPNPDGSLDVFAIYEYGELEGCVRGYPTRKEGRVACLAKLSKTHRAEAHAARWRPAARCAWGRWRSPTPTARPAKRRRSSTIWIATASWR